MLLLQLEMLKLNYNEFCIALLVIKFIEQDLIKVSKVKCHFVANHRI